MASEPPNQKQLEGASQPAAAPLRQPVLAQATNGVSRPTNHFGLLDVPPPVGAYKSPYDRPGNSSIDMPQCAGTHILTARDSLETATQPSRSGDVQSLGSIRSRDALAAAVSADRSHSAAEPPASLTPSGRPIRPKAIALMHSGDSRGKAASASQLNAVVPMGGVEASKLEGSATSDENMQPRLVPRKGAGPDLRKEGGGRIDEYLMRLLRNGNSQSAETRQAVLKGETAAAEAGLLALGRSNAAQWQGSRLGPLAPGAGVKLSSVPAGQHAPPSLPPTGQRVNWSLSSAPAAPAAITQDTVPELSRPGRQSLTSQPSTTGAETSQELAQRSQSAQFRGAGDGLERVGTGVAAPNDTPSRPGSGEPAGCGSSRATDSRAASRAQQAMGKEPWLWLRARLMEQAEEFEKQLEALHQLVHRQQQLQTVRQPSSAGGSLGSPAGLQASPGNRSGGKLPPLFVGQPPTAGQSAFPGGHPNSAWWLSTMPWANLNGASMPPGRNGLVGEETAQPQAQQQLSRTTQIALDAQRRRRNATKTFPKPLSKSGKTASLNRTGSHIGSEQLHGSGLSAGQSGFNGPPKEASIAPPQSSTWFSVMSPYLQNQARGADRGSATPPQMPGPASQPQAQPPQSNGRSAGGAGHFDPLSAWYHYHFGQYPGAFRGSPGQPSRPNSATYGSQLAGLSIAVPEQGWENNCNQYFNFSMPGTSDNKTGNTGPTSSRQQPSLAAHNQAMSAPRAVMHAPLPSKHNRERSASAKLPGLHSREEDVDNL